MVHLIKMPVRFSGGFLNSIQSWKQRTHLCKDAQILTVSFFLRGVRDLGTHFFQPFFNKIKAFLCALDRKLPELLKTYPTFITLALLGAPKSIQLKILLV